MGDKRSGGGEQQGEGVRSVKKGRDGEQDAWERQEERGRERAERGGSGGWGEEKKSRGGKGDGGEARDADHNRESTVGSVVIQPQVTKARTSRGVCSSSR